MQKSSHLQPKQVIGTFFSSQTSRQTFWQLAWQPQWAQQPPSAAARAANPSRAIAASPRLNKLNARILPLSVIATS
jgi:hypothetical protein